MDARVRTALQQGSKVVFLNLKKMLDKKGDIYFRTYFDTKLVLGLGNSPEV
jgi:hypothetical protein